MYIYIYTHTYTCMCAYTYIHIYIYIHIIIHVYGATPAKRTMRGFSYAVARGDRGSSTATPSVSLRLPVGTTYRRSALPEAVRCSLNCF